jgi:hypothetical protein
MSTIYVVYVSDPQTGEAFYQCETTHEDRAQDEVDRINGHLSDAGRPCTAYYTP